MKIFPSWDDLYRLLGAVRAVGENLNISRTLECLSIYWCAALKNAKRAKSLHFLSDYSFFLILTINDRSRPFSLPVLGLG